MNKSEKLFLPYEISRQLKSVGYKEESLGFYIESFGKPKLQFSSFVYNKENTNVECVMVISQLNGVLCLAPTYQQVVDWFDIENGLIIEIHTNLLDYEFTINSHKNNKVNCLRMNYGFDDYYKCYNKAIEEALSILKNELKNEL